MNSSSHIHPKYYSRNNVSLGEAFTNMRFGPGIAYFPSMSLSGGENLRVNFGSTSFRHENNNVSPVCPICYTCVFMTMFYLIMYIVRYPVPGYQPLEAPCHIELIKARHLFAYWDTLVHNWVVSRENNIILIIYFQCCFYLHE